MFDINTFGRTPAAHYLSRRLIEIGDKKLTRSCTVRINAFNTNVAGIVSAVATGGMNVKVAANLLRLLREEATKIKLSAFYTDVNELEFVDNLVRNVIIGHIKSALRKTCVMRKIENASKDINTITRKGSRVVAGPHIIDVDYFVMGYHAGYMSPDWSAKEDLDYPPPGIFSPIKQCISEIDDPTTPELLHKRSLNRCTRQNKKWTNEL